MVQLFEKNKGAIDELKGLGINKKFLQVDELQRIATGRIRVPNWFKAIERYVIVPKVGDKVPIVPHGVTKIFVP